jgi:mycofactocin system creatininase family protein
VTGLGRSTWPEIDASPREALIWPMGSTEQHGPHLPLGTDAWIAEHVAAELHRLRPRAGLAPVLTLGASGEHADFPGTLSIGTDALTNVIVELVRDASRWWPAVLVVNAHGGNLDATQRALLICREEGRRVAVVHLGRTGMDAHAGRSETSLMLHVEAEVVHLDRAQVGPAQPVVELLDRLREEGVRAVSPNGVLGNPEGASVGEGADLCAGLVEQATTAYDMLLG